MHKILYIILASPMAFSGGCLSPFWVSPSIGFVPANQVNAPDDKVFAFRVNTRESTAYFPGPLHQIHQLTPITQDSNGALPAQFDLSCTRGFFAFFVALNYCTWHQDTISVRLYRPGYKTIELKSWDLNKAVKWRTAETLAAQCQAVDELLGGRVEPGGIAATHRGALLFASDEYNRLASLVTDPDSGVQRQQILNKAENLRKLAEEKYERGFLERIID